MSVLTDRLRASSDPMRHEAAQRIEALEFEIDWLSTDKTLLQLQAQIEQYKENEAGYLLALQQAEAALDLALNKENP